MNISKLTWVFPNRFQQHARLGPAFVIVMSAAVQLVLAGPEAVNEFLARRFEFMKDFDTVRLCLDVFGLNVVTAGNETWARHRRLTHPPFKEAQSRFVWREALSQSATMIQIWMKRGKNGVQDCPSNIMTLNLHV